MAAGFSLRETPPRIAAAIGTATHAGAAYSMREVIDAGGGFAKFSRNGRDAAISSLEGAVSQGIGWDDVSPTAAAAQRQVGRQYTVWAEQVAPLFLPREVEVRYEADVRGGFVLSGQPDVTFGDVIRDLKTGVRKRANGAQYGAYSLLLQANGLTINGLIEDYIPRAPVSRAQPDAQTIEIDIAEAEAAAERIIKRMIADLVEFRVTGEPWSFMANPASMLCSDKWCPAWGTRFCRAHAKG